MANDGGSTKLTGDPLRQYVRQYVKDYRDNTGLKTKAELTTTPEGQAANRYFGKDLAKAAQGAQLFFQGAEPTGIFKGLPFTLQDLEAAIARVNDAQTSETPVAALAADVHAEGVSARCALALMVLAISEIQKMSLAHPGLPQEVKGQVQDTGAELGSHMKDLAQSRKQSGKDTRTLHATQEALTTAEAQNAQHEEAAAVTEAQKDLRLRFLSGEALRPEDAVVAPSAIKASGEAPGPTKPGHKPTHPRRKGPGSGATPPGKGQGRRKPRGG